jgi:hypothetical protein
VQLKRRAWFGVIAAVCVAGVTMAGCGADTDGSPVGPSLVSLTLSSRIDVIPANGTLEITAIVTNLAGGTVPDGTPVTFTTTLGRVEPASTTTRNGTATATFFAGTSVGNAEVRATSGSVPSTNALQLSVGGASIQISVNARDLGGLNVEATAVVTGATPVQFEWYFQRASLPEVTTTAGLARYQYPSPGFKDINVRVTLSDGRRALGSAAVILNEFQ